MANTTNWREACQWFFFFSKFGRSEITSYVAKMLVNYLFIPTVFTQYLFVFNPTCFVCAVCLPRLLGCSPGCPRIHRRSSGSTCGRSIRLHCPCRIRCSIGCCIPGSKLPCLWPFQRSCRQCCLLRLIFKIATQKSLKLLVLDFMKLLVFLVLTFN